MTKEERWVPIAESGARWAPRSKEAAEACLRDYPAGGQYTDGEPWDGVTHIVHEVRYVTEWREVE